MTQPAELAAPPPLAPAHQDAHAVAASILSEIEAASPTPPVPTGEAPRAPSAEASASHDTPPPKALVEFMVQGWAPPTGLLPEPIPHAEFFRARRQALSARYPG